MARPNQRAGSERAALSEELRGIYLGGGGWGSLIVLRSERRWANSRVGRWISNEASLALTRAAARLGFGHELVDGWMAVVRAIEAGALPDLLSEAIEETESI